MNETNVYLIHDPITGWYKIGRSYNPRHRERTLLAQAPQIRLVCYWRDCPEECEKWRHDDFKHVRKRGEWFALGEKEIIRLYGLQMRYARVDGIPPDPVLWPRIVEYGFHWAALAGNTRRYGAINWKTGDAEPPDIPCEMEWYEDGTYKREWTIRRY